MDLIYMHLLLFHTYVDEREKSISVVVRNRGERLKHVWLTCFRLFDEHRRNHSFDFS